MLGWLYGEARDLGLLTDNLVFLSKFTPFDEDALSFQFQVIDHSRSIIQDSVIHPTLNAFYTLLVMLTPSSLYIVTK